MSGVFVSEPDRLELLFLQHALVSGNALADFATAPTWAQKGMPDFVNTTDNTDQNAVSTGCGMAFLSWLQHLGFTLDKIAPAMVALGTSGTLAQLYAKLTSDGQSNAWPKFQAAAKALPQIATDDPFGTVSGAGKKGALKGAKGHRSPGAKKTVRTK
jgi:hypothetical protein